MESSAYAKPRKRFGFIHCTRTDDMPHCLSVRRMYCSTSCVVNDMPEFNLFAASVKLFVANFEKNFSVVWRIRLYKFIAAKINDIQIVKRQIFPFCSIVTIMRKALDNRFLRHFLQGFDELGNGDCHAQRIAEEGGGTRVFLIILCLTRKSLIIKDLRGRGGRAVVTRWFSESYGGRLSPPSFHPPCQPKTSILSQKNSLTPISSKKRCS